MAYFSAKKRLMNFTTSRSRLPRRFLLRWLDRFEFPIVGLVTILTALFSLWFTPIKIWGLLWSTLIFCLWILGRRAIDWEQSERAHRCSFLSPHSNCFISIVLLLLTTVLFIYASRQISLLNLLALTPVYIPPIILFLRYKTDSRFNTYVVVVLAFAITFILFIGAWNSIHLSLPSPLSDFSKPREIFPVTALILWALFGPMYFYYLLRRLQLDQIRGEAIQEAILSILSVNDPWEDASEVADILRVRAGLGERVLITHYDNITDKVLVLGGSGKGTERISGYELPYGRGISRRAIKRRKTQYAPNVLKDPDFVSGGLPEKGSEVVVPIIATQSEDAEVLGTINVQDDVVYAFTKEDIRAVERFAHVIAQSGLMDTKQFEKTLQNKLQEISNIIEYNTLVRRVLSIAQSLFPDSLLCYYRLAAGTGVPIRSPYLEGDFRDPQFFSAQSLFEMDSNLVEWIVDWQPRFIRHLEGAPGLRDQGYGFGKSFQKREEIHSMCFLPIGSQHSRLSVLLLFFRQVKIFSHVETRNLRAFVRETWPYITRIEYLEAFHNGFAGLHLHFHSILAEVGLGKGGMETIFDGIFSRLRRTDPGFIQRVVVLQKGIKKLSESVDHLKSDHSIWNHYPKQFSFREELGKVCNDLGEQYSGNVVRDIIDDSIEDENIDTKFILLSLISEAVRNAFVHGKANRVTVKIRLQPHCIKIEVADNGNGFNPVQRRRDLESSDSIRQGSIFWFDTFAQSRLGANPINWLDTAPGRSTRLLWEIPVLPRRK